ncbi:MAG: sensor histidine kinase [Spirochaetales bacterium]|nr:sensor histidine kinase [Spirochaetales bacterium]MCF7937910.1 sensor histidine kinase [Spirochaetales bacterium]
MSTYLVPIILSISILLQLASAVTALLLVRTSGFFKPWLFVSAAISLMAVRRIISLINILESGIYPASSFWPELIALFISVIMLTGLLLFRPVFYKIRCIQQTSQKELKEKEMLMKELNHRVKNNLAMVESLINLKNASLGEKIDLSNLFNQINAIKIVHEKLIESNTVTHMDVKSYLSEILNQLFSENAFPPGQLVQDIDELQVRTKTAIPLGLVVNEIATNTVKYGRDEENRPSFFVSLKKTVEPETGRNRGVSKERPTKECTLEMSNRGPPCRQR